MELWKNIIDYEDSYQVSNFGKVKSLKNNSKILKNRCVGRGYYQVTLCGNGKPKQFLIHRLVAIHFIKNDESYNEVNHVNGDKSDNSIYNLEWVNKSKNEIHAYKIGLKNTKNKKPVCQYDLQNNLLSEFNSISEASNKTNINSSIISLCLSGKYSKVYKKPHKYIWKLKNIQA